MILSGLRNSHRPAFVITEVMPYFAPAVARNMKWNLALCSAALALSALSTAQTPDVSGKWYGRLTVTVDEQAIREKAGEKFDQKMVDTIKARVQQAKKMLVILTLNKDGSFSAMTKNAPKGTTPVNSGKWTLRGNDVFLTGYKSDTQKLSINLKTASMSSTIKGGPTTVTTVFTRR